MDLTTALGMYTALFSLSFSLSLNFFFSLILEQINNKHVDMWRVKTIKQHIGK